MRMIFVNLPVQDLERAKRFLEAIGFAFEPNWSNDQTACMTLEENIHVLLHTHARFKDFIAGEIADTSRGTEALLCLSASSREEVDCTLETALAAGGRPWLPKQDMGPMYGCSFQDPEGHVWELSYVDLAALQPA